MNYPREYAIVCSMKKYRTISYEIPVSGSKYQIEGRVRLALLSDLHGQVYGRDNAPLAEDICRAEPDFIVAAGDMLTSSEEENEEVALALLARLAKRCPIYYANGNHEQRMARRTDSYGLRYEKYEEELRRMGVHLLRDSYEDFACKGLPLRVYGLEIPWQYYRRFRRAVPDTEEMKQLLGDGSGERYQILIAHNPMCFPAYAAWGADLSLSGHLHGGFIRLPLLGGILTPQCIPFPRYDRGLFEKDGHYLAVSAGLGTHDGIPRFGNPTELVLIDLV